MRVFFNNSDISASVPPNICSTISENTSFIWWVKIVPPSNKAKNSWVWIVYNRLRCIQVDISNQMSVKNTNQNIINLVMGTSDLCNCITKIYNKIKCYRYLFCDRIISVWVFVPSSFMRYQDFALIF